MKFQIRNVRTFIAEFVGIILRNWGGQSIWGLGSIVRMKRESKKLRRNNVENVDAGECLNCTGEKMLHAIFAWRIGKAGLEKILRKLGSWIRTTGINIRRRKRCITRNIARGKLNVKCVSVELGNLIGQDIWWVGSICWGAVVEKLVVMGGGWGRMRWRVSMSYSLLCYLNQFLQLGWWTNDWCWCFSIPGISLSKNRFHWYFLGYAAHQESINPGVLEWGWWSHPLIGLMALSCRCRSFVGTPRSDREPRTARAFFGSRALKRSKACTDFPSIAHSSIGPIGQWKWAYCEKELEVATSHWSINCRSESISI